MNLAKQHLMPARLGVQPYWRLQQNAFSDIVGYWLLDERSGTVASNVQSNSGNIVLNPGFEYAGGGGADVFANWTEGTGTGAIAIETSLVHSGSRAAKITAGTTFNTYIAATLTVVPGTTYNFTFWTYADGIHPGRYLIYDLSNNAVITNHTSTALPAAAWNQFSGSFTAPANCTSVSFRLECPAGNTYVVYYDDLVVTAPSATSPFKATYVNCSLGQPGWGDGKTAVSLNGTSSYVNVYSPAFLNAFNPSEFSIRIWFKVSSASIWSDSQSHVLFRITADSSNYIILYKVNTPNNTIYCQYVAGGTSVATTLTTTTTDWTELIMSVSKSADELKMYVNGVQTDTTKNGLGTWTTTAPITTVVLGASTTAPASPWSGNLAHLLVAGPAKYPSGRLRIPIDAADVNSSGHIYAGRAPRLYKSTDGGNTWTTKYTVPGSPQQIARVFCDSRDYVFVSGRSGSTSYGLYRSIDGGDNFSQVLSTTEGALWAFDEDPSGNLYTGLHAFGANTLAQIWKSTDDGATWVKKFEADYSSPMQNHVHDIRYDTRTNYLYATIGDQVSTRLIRSVDGGENWTVVETGEYQLLAIAFLGDYVYVGTDRGSGNRIFRFTDDGSATVTLEDALVLDEADDVAIFAAGEYNNKAFFLGYKEGKTKNAKLYVYDGTSWTTPHTVSSTVTNRGFYTLSRHQYNGKFYISNDYGAPAGYGLIFEP